MSSSAFLQIQAALATALTAAVTTTGAAVYVNRTRAMGRDVDMAVLVRLVGARDDEGPLGAQDWLTAFDVESVARAATGTDPAQSVDALLQAVWSAIRGMSLPDAIEVAASPQIRWDFDAVDTPQASATVQVNVRHRAAPGTLQPWSSTP